MRQQATRQVTHGHPLTRLTMAVVFVVLVAACGSSSGSDAAIRSTQAFCTELDAGVSAMGAASTGSTVDRALQLANNVGSFDRMLQRMDASAPVEIETEMRASLEVWDSIKNDLGEAVSNPLSASAGVVIAVMAGSGSLSAVDSFAAQNCGTAVFGLGGLSTGAGFGDGQADSATTVSDPVAAPTPVPPPSLCAVLSAGERSGPLGTLLQEPLGSVAGLDREIDAFLEPFVEPGLLLDAIAALTTKLDVVDHLPSDRAYEVFGRARFAGLSMADELRAIDDLARDQCGLIAFGSSAANAVEDLAPAPTADGGVRLTGSVVFGDCEKPRVATVRPPRSVIQICDIDDEFLVAHELDLRDGSIVSVTRLPWTGYSTEVFVTDWGVGWFEYVRTEARGLNPEQMTLVVHRAPYGGPFETVTLVPAVDLDGFFNPFVKVLLSSADRILVEHAVPGAAGEARPDNRIVVLDGAANALANYGTEELGTNAGTGSALAMSGLALVGPTTSIELAGASPLVDGAGERFRGFINAVDICGTSAIYDMRSYDGGIVRVGQTSGGFSISETIPLPFNPSYWSSLPIEGGVLIQGGSPEELYAVTTAGEIKWSISRSIVNSFVVLGRFVFVQNKAGEWVNVDPDSGQERPDDEAAASFRVLLSDQANLDSVTAVVGWDEDTIAFVRPVRDGVSVDRVAHLMPASHCALSANDDASGSDADTAADPVTVSNEVPSRAGDSAVPADASLASSADVADFIAVLTQIWRSGDYVDAEEVLSEQVRLEMAKWYPEEVALLDPTCAASGQCELLVSDSAGGGQALIFVIELEPNSQGPGGLGLVRLSFAGDAG